MMLDYTPQAVPRAAKKDYTPQQRQAFRTPNTPDQPVLMLAAYALGGAIDVDCTADDALSVPAKLHITAACDFLRPVLTAVEGEVCRWNDGGNAAFMNPPFGNPKPFVERLLQAHQLGVIDSSIMLLKSGCIHNKGTGTLIRNHSQAVCFWGAGKASRLAFLDHEGEQVVGADFDCIFVYTGLDRYRFAGIFQDYGTVLML